jgi:glycosyltransferase involved in cell wall biosynthesis
MNAAVVTDCAGLFSNLCEQDGIPVFMVDPLREREDALRKGDLPPGEQLAVKLREFDAEVIHCHDVYAAKTVVAVANSIKVPCVISLHGGLGPLVPHFIAAKHSGMEFTIIAVCKEDFEFMQKTDMAGIDFHYVPNATSVSSGMRQQERGGSCRPNLILVGGLVFRKGIDLAILAMFELRRKRGSDCPVLNIYGEGESGDYFIEMTRILHLDDVVKFHGIEMGILDKCPNSDVLIAPSRQETGPLVVLEAMSRGMPVVATSVGEVNEMVPGQQYGRVVPVNSITALADAMDSILTDITSGQFNPDLPVKRHRSQYSIEKMADRIEAIYQSAATRLVTL